MNPWNLRNKLSAPKILWWDRHRITVTDIPSQKRKWKERGNHWSQAILKRSQANSHLISGPGNKPMWLVASFLPPRSACSSLLHKPHSGPCPNSAFSFKWSCNFGPHNAAREILKARVQSFSFKSRGTKFQIDKITSWQEEGGTQQVSGGAGETKSGHSILLVSLSSHYTFPITLGEWN